MGRVDNYDDRFSSGADTNISTVELNFWYKKIIKRNEINRIGTHFYLKLSPFNL